MVCAFALGGSAVQAEDGSLQELEVDLVLGCGTPTPGLEVASCLADAQLVWDGRLVVDERFSSNDPSIMGAGPVAKFSRCVRISPLPWMCARKVTFLKHGGIAPCQVSICKQLLEPFEWAEGRLCAQPYICFIQLGSHLQAHNLTTFPFAVVS
jgi:hypothetical protein